MICHRCTKTGHYDLEGFGNDPLIEIGIKGSDFFSIAQAAFKRLDGFIAQSYLMTVHGRDSGCLYGHFAQYGSSLRVVPVPVKYGIPDSNKGGFEVFYIFCLA